MEKSPYRQIETMRKKQTLSETADYKGGTKMAKETANNETVNTTSNLVDSVDSLRAKPVSYTHLDVYKRQTKG